MNRLMNISQLRCILLLLSLGVIFSFTTTPPVAAQDADFDAVGPAGCRRRRKADAAD